MNKPIMNETAPKTNKIWNNVANAKGFEGEGSKGGLASKGEDEGFEGFSKGEDEGGFEGFEGEDE